MNPICNLCGLSCMLTTRAGGLVKATVWGGYESTPGNGVGALDDHVEHTFSLCEFCLDWLFSRFVIPVELRDYFYEPLEPWRPAAERVAADDWRRDKKRFADEAARRAAARRPSDARDYEAALRHCVADHVKTMGACNTKEASVPVPGCDCCECVARAALARQESSPAAAVGTQALVEEFHRAIDATVGTTPAIRDPDLRAALILEEAIETVTAIVGTRAAADMLHNVHLDAGNLHRVSPAGPDLVKAVDGLCDLEYVTRGTAVAFGVQLDPFVRVVHEANMTKVNGPVDEHGKRGKPPGFVPPDETIREMLIALGWKP